MGHMETQTQLTPVGEIQSGDVIAFDPIEPVWVTALKVKAGNYGYDVLYQHNGSEPHWRGFDDTDKVLKR